MPSENLSTPRQPAPEPVAVNVTKGLRRFEVTWDGGGATRIGFDDLRLMCECAVCREEHEKRDNPSPGSRTLPILSFAAGPEIVSVHHVGRYALGVKWKDGHESIFTHDILFRYSGTETPPQAGAS